MLLAATTFTNIDYTWIGGTTDFSGVNLFKIRTGAGLTTTVNGSLGYDTTNHMLHSAQNSADAYVPQATITPTNDDCVKWVVSGSNYKLGSAGSTCGTGGSTSYVIPLLYATSTNPLDATTYYAAWGSSSFSTTENAVTKYPITQAGTITKIQFIVAVTGTVGSNENVTVTLRVNGVDTAITGTMPWDGSTSNISIGSFTGSVAVSVGDIITIKIVTPTWATNPTTVRAMSNITIG